MCSGNSDCNSSDCNGNPHLWGEINIMPDGTIYCNDEMCLLYKAQSAPCADCLLNSIFAEMFQRCDPRECKQVLCEGCTYKHLYEKRRIELEDDQFKTLI